MIAIAGYERVWRIRKQADAVISCIIGDYGARFLRIVEHQRNAGAGEVIQVNVPEYRHFCRSVQVDGFTVLAGMYGRDICRI